jgi:DNA-binding NtrC family response regulator
VLVVDDDGDMRRALELLLSSQYRVITCATATKGVEAFNDEVCAVVLDVKMKGNDGFWACDEIRKLSADVPVIFYSAYQDVKDPFDIINRHRPFAYVSKDGSSKRLLDTVEMATRLYRTTIRSRRIIAQIRSRRAEAR